MPMNGITIRQINTTDPEYQKVWELREEILRRPIGLSLAEEDLSGEKDEIILAAFDKGVVVACLILQGKDANTIKYRQMAVAAEAQGKGIGRTLMEEAEKLSAQKGYSRIILHARESAADFYAKLGFSIKSDSFTEVGIPHLLMEKELRS
jgi:predicted GNAT family N-acyltransferase